MVEGKRFKSQDKSLRKQMIIDTAVKIFHRKGYRAATLDDVAHELGLTRPAIYHYVSSKEDLLSQIYLQALESFCDTIYEITAMDLTAPEKLKIFVYRHLNTVVIENIAMFTVFFSEENQLAKKDFQKIRKEKRKFTRVVENIIIEGMEQGYFRPVNPQLQANAIIGMCNWLYRWYKPGRSSFTPDQIMDQFTSLLENGLLRADKKSDDFDRAEPTDGHKTQRHSRSQILKELKANTRKTAALVDELENL
jgi:TetR/AcrR family transcriptional regulator, cholesterol catabolism regulator